MLVLGKNDSLVKAKAPFLWIAVGMGNAAMRLYYNFKIRQCTFSSFEDFLAQLKQVGLAFRRTLTIMFDTRRHDETTPFDFRRLPVYGPACFSCSCLLLGDLTPGEFLWLYHNNSGKIFKSFSFITDGWEQFSYPRFFLFYATFDDPFAFLTHLRRLWVFRGCMRSKT